MCDQPRGARGSRRALVILIILTGCGGGALTGPLVPQPTLQSRCKLGASQSSLLVTEWSAAEKANLEAMLGGGAVAVAFSGCELRLVPSCRLRGAYGWQRTTPSTDYLEIGSEAELYAKLPLGAAALDGELRRSGALTMTTTVAGQRRLDGMAPAEALADPACVEATHVIDAISLGAYALSAGGQVTGTASVAAPGMVQAGGTTQQSARVVRAAGRAEACADSGEAGPEVACASPIRVFLATIPGRGEPVGPPGTVRTDIVSTSPNVRWDVLVNDQATCTTPCSVWLDPTRPLAMRSREEGGQKLTVRRLPHDLGPLQVAARPRQNGPFATGVVFTTFGGIGVIAGVTLTAVGCSTDRDTMCSAGLVTGVVGGVVTAGAIWLMRRALGKAYVGPVFPDAGGVRF